MPNTVLTIHLPFIRGPDPCRDAERREGATVTGRLKNGSRFGAAAGLILALLAAAPGCGSSNDTTVSTPPATTTTSGNPNSASELAPVHGAYHPTIDPA